MKKNLLLILVLAVVCSCSKTSAEKETQPDPDPVKNCLITQTDRANFNPHIYEYDDKGRVIKHIYSDFVNTIEYNALSVTNTQTDKLNLHYRKIISVNVKGFALNIRTENPNGTWYNESFQYDGD